MSHVVTKLCEKCTECVAVCPVNSFHEDKDMLVINPETCIDCGACVPECPVNAIYAEDDVPEQWKEYIKLNAEKASQLPLITEKKS